MYALYIFYFSVACMVCGLNELVDERFLVTCVPESQSSVKTIKKCLLLKSLRLINSILGPLNKCVFIFLCTGCCHFYEFLVVELLIIVMFIFQSEYSFKLLFVIFLTSECSHEVSTLSHEVAI